MYVPWKGIALFVCALGLAALGAHAQPYRFEPLQVPGGGNENVVTDVTQDEQGFMWVGTWGGVHRYDGYTFTTYAHDPDDSTSLGANWAECLYVDSEGTIWVGTYGGGLNRFDPETETFTRYQREPGDPTSLSQDSVTVILEDSHGVLWVGTMGGGLNRFDRDSGTFTRYRYDPEDPTSLGNDQVRALYEDRRGILWVGTNSPFPGERDNPGPGGLNRFDRETETFTRYLHDPKDRTSLISNHVTSLYEDRRGTLWVGTMGNVLHQMDREAGTFTRHAYDQGASGTLGPPERPALPPSCYGDTCGLISFIDEDRQGALWIGAYGTGAFRYDPETGALTAFEPDLKDPSSVSSRWVWSTLESWDGTRWITTLGGGIDNVRRAGGPFEHHTSVPSFGANWLGALHIGPSGRLWVISIGSIASFARRGGDARSYQVISTRPYSGVNIAALEHTRDGTLWAGTYEGTSTTRHGGLYRMDRETGALTPVLTDSARDGTLVGPIVALHEDEDGALWLGTRWSSLFRMDRETGTLTHYAHDSTDPTSLSHDNVTTLYEAPSEPGVLWVGTEGGGLNRLDQKTGIFMRYRHDPADPSSLSSNHVTDVYEDPSGRLWVGTRRGGLNQFDRASETFTRFTAYNSGLPDNHVACLLGDSGSLWMGTGQGLTRFDPEAGLFYTYGAEHGVVAAPFMAGACDRGPAGELVFGGINGFVAFDPDEVRTDRSGPPVVVTGFLLARQPVSPGPESPLERPIWKAEKIRLAHHEHTFSFEFAALDYRDPAANQYAYQLEGYDEAWREAGTQRQASYHRVPPGEYVFRIKAASSDGVWNEEGASIRITVLPPWWRTRWAYVLYGLLFAAGVFAVDRIQRRRLVRREREKARERELEQEKAHAREIEQAYQELQHTQQQLIHAEKMASLGQLTAGIAHEIKNPLNFVTNFAELSSELAEELKTAAETGDLEEVQFIAEDLKTNAEKIEEHGQRADGIVRSMMQHARGGPGEREAVDLNALVDEYVDLAYHGKRAATPDFTATIKRDLSENVGTVEVVPQEMGRVILNLVGNAFDAVYERQQSADGAYAPTVRIAIRRTDGQVEIRVADNGPGIPDDIREKIFEPFFTTKPAGSGTGLGLSLSYDIVTQGHGGSLSVENEDEQGAVFTITLPTR